MHNVPLQCYLIFLMAIEESYLIEEFGRSFISLILKREKFNDVIAKEAFHSLTPF